MDGCRQRGRGIRRAFVLALAVAVSSALVPVRVTGNQTASPVEVKAAFLYNFAKFVEWPPEATSGVTTINVGVWGSDALGEALRAVVRDKTVGGRGFTVKRPAGSTISTGCTSCSSATQRKTACPTSSNGWTA